MNTAPVVRRARRHALAAIAAAGLLAGLAGPLPALSQPTWPSRPVKLIIPFPAGGATDTLGRVLAQTLEKDIGQPVLVENRPGAAGAIGAAVVEKSAPDGYTLLLGTSSTHSILPHLSSKPPYDAINDFTPIAQVAEGASLLVVSPGLAATNLSQLIAMGREKPGRLSYGSSGIGSIPHLNGAYFAGLAGIQATHVPYKGSSLAYPDMKEGRVDFMIDSIVSALPQVRAGTVRALAITSTKRSPLAPEIPTIAESGLPTFQSTVWFGLFGPRSMDPALTAAIAAAVRKALQSDELKEKYAGLGVEASALGPADFARTIAQESQKWKKVITDHGIRAE